MRWGEFSINNNVNSTKNGLILRWLSYSEYFANILESVAGDGNAAVDGLASAKLIRAKTGGLDAATCPATCPATCHGVVFDEAGSSIERRWIVFDLN